MEYMCRIYLFIHGSRTLTVAHHRQNDESAVSYLTEGQIEARRIPYRGLDLVDRHPGNLRASDRLAQLRLVRDSHMRSMRMRRRVKDQKEHVVDPP